MAQADMNARISRKWRWSSVCNGRPTWQAVGTSGKDGSMADRDERDMIREALALLEPHVSDD